MAFNPQNPNGSAVSASSSPVVIASDQAAVPISSATLATAAKQDTLLTELQLKADLTETQPVSLASVPSHAVTNVGTFAVQNTAATPAGTNAIGSVSITSNSLVSTANSSTTNLAGAAVFTGTSEDVTEYSTIVVSVFSSHVSATDGLSIQQSSDGTNWDFTDVYSIPAATGKSFSVPVQAKFYRVVYTNGATLTTSLRIQSIFSKEGKKGSSVRPQDARTNDNDFEEVATYLNVYNGTTWDRARGDITNGLDVDVTRLPALVAGSAVIGALTANQSVNNAQIAGVATAVGSGVTGTGVQRVVLATDVVLPSVSELRAATLHVTATAAANTAITATLPAVAGQFHYITNIHLMRNATAALGGTATLIHTSANLPGSPAWSVGNLMAAGGTQLDLNYTPTTPLKSTVANTATTITMPAAGAAVLNRINISYFTAA